MAEFADVLEPFAHSSGPRNAKIALVGEAWGKDEETTGLPFMGAAGSELTRMLQEADLRRGECFITNTLAARPPGNKLEEWCVGSKEAKATGADLLPPLKRGKWLESAYHPHLQRLWAELSEVRPNLVVALGGTAAWALLDSSAITSIRGAATETSSGPLGRPGGLKVLPTFHPASVLRAWDQRVVVLADLGKAKREKEFPEVRIPHRRVLIDPTLEEVLAFAERDWPVLSTDIETAKGQITCIGFAPSIHEAIVVPFADHRFPGKSYWPTHDLEVRAWRAVGRLLASPIPKLFQNGMYDLMYLARAGFRVMNCAHDTMLHHHALFSELPKGLGFMGSVYTNERSWKLARKRSKEVEKPNE